MLKLLIKTLIVFFIVGGILYPLNQLDLKSLDSLVANKTRGLKQQSRNINTIFFGTSATRHGIDPLILDSLMANAGFPTRTFNFAINGLPTIGQQFHLEKFLDHNSPRLRTVFFELSYPFSFLSPADLYSWRFIETHDTKRFRQYTNYLWWQFGGLSRLTTITDRAYLYSRSISLSGRAEQIHDALYPAPIALSPPASQTERYTGFTPCEELSAVIIATRLLINEPGGEEQFYHFLTKKSEIPERIKTRKEDVVLINIFQEIIDVCKARGIQVIFYLPPKPYHYRSLVQAYRQRNLEAPLINMNLPLKYPELFSIENWFDISHVNHKGAKLLTRTFVEQILELPQFSIPSQAIIPSSKHYSDLLPSEYNAEPQY